VSGDTDISDAFQWKGAGHGGGLREVYKTRASLYRLGLQGLKSPWTSAAGW